MSSFAEPVFDQDAVLARVGGNRELLQNLIEVFYNDCNSLMNSLKNAIQAEDSSGVRAAAHTIKGMVAFFEAKKATELLIEFAAPRTKVRTN